MVFASMTYPSFLAVFRGDPLLDIAGAYFPAWLAAMLLGGLLTWLFWVVLGFVGCRAALRPEVLFLPAAFVAFSCTIWLLFFSA